MDFVTGYGVAERSKGPDKHILRLLRNHPELFNIEMHELGRLKRIGSGAFGTVYKAKYKGEPVAVKRIETFDENSPKVDVYKYLVREILNLKKVKHENVLKYIGLAHKEERKIYMVTDLVNGGTLGKINKKLKKKFAILLEICCKVAFAMRYLNSQNMIHRDLKPENILVFNCTNFFVIFLFIAIIQVSNDFSLVKLCDFGMSITPGDDVGVKPKDRTLERKRTCVGTKQFMAPEMKQGEGSFAADVYSFGIMLAEIFGFSSKSELFTQKKIKNVPEDLIDLVRICVNPDPKKRPTFSVIASELIRIHNDYYRDYPPIADEDIAIAMDVAVPTLIRKGSKGSVLRKSRTRSLDFSSQGRSRGVVILERTDYLENLVKESTATL